MSFKSKVLDFLNLEAKGHSTFYPLNSDFNQLIGFDSLSSTLSDQGLIDNSYGSNVTAYAIIKKIAQSGAEVDKVLIDLNDPEEIIEDGEVFDMLQRPGIFQGESLSQYDYFEALITYLLANGNTYQRGTVSTGFGDIWQSMELLPSGQTQPLVGGSYLSPVLGYQFNDKQKDFMIEFEEVIHTKFVNPTQAGLNTLKGLSPIQAAIFALTGSTDIQKAIAVMVKNQGARGVLTNKSDRSLKKEEANLLSDRANENLRGVRNFNKIHVSNTDMAYLQMGMNATDLKVIESGVLTDRQLCNAYGVSSRLFNDPANSTFNNVKEATKSMFTQSIIPILNKLLEDINHSWLAQWSLRDNKRYSFQLDTSGIEALQADQKEEAEKDKIVVEGVSVIMNMPISQEGKIELLKDTYNYSDEVANAITNTTTNE